MNPKNWTREQWDEFWDAAILLPALLMFYALMWIIA